MYNTIKQRTNTHIMKMEPVDIWYFYLLNGFTAD